RARVCDRRRDRRGRLRDGPAVAARPAGRPLHDLRRRQQPGGLHGALAGSARRGGGGVRRTERRLRLQVKTCPLNAPVAHVALGIVTALVLWISVRADSNDGETRAFRYLMGTSVQVQAFGGDESARKQAIEEAF